jgi:hypothetical protein
MPCASAATRCGALPSLSLPPRTALPSTAITSRPLTCTDLVHSQVPRTWSSMSALIMANARPNVDSSAGPRAAPRPASTSAPASAAHCPIAANDLDPAITAAIPTASSQARGCRRPRLPAPFPGIRVQQAPDTCEARTSHQLRGGHRSYHRGRGSGLRRLCAAGR